jgi:hypothetical protein
MTTETQAVRIDPTTRFVRSLPGEYFLLREAAAACGVSPFVLRKYISEDVPECTPSKYTMFGKVKIYLYTKADIKSIQDYMKKRIVVFEHDGQARRIGRPPKYSDEQRHWRDQQHSKKWYWKNRVRLLTEKGDEAGAAKAQKRVDEIERELRKK